MSIEISDILHNKLWNIHTKQADKYTGRVMHNNDKFLAHFQNNNAKTENYQ